ncbi:MAG: FkbM family methyltransferase [Cytophagales bacterium]|nr:MAG: FkbM family methyltransferase [Cytophagales bacterium]
MLRLLKFITSHPLNKDNKIGAVMRFAKWQLNTILNGHPIVYKFTENSRLIIVKGMAGATQNLYCGLHEFYDMGFLLHLLRPSDLFVDIGANVGSFTILASAEIGADAISIEPVPSTFQHLKNNISVNNIHDRVESLNLGLGNRTGHIKFTKSHDTMNHVASGDEEGTIDVEINTLDNVLKGRQPILLKIDVEGFETEVLKGAEKALIQKELKAIIIELNGSGQRYGYDEAKIYDKLLDLGFMSYQYDPFTRKLIEINTSGAHNTIFIRDLNFVSDRLMKARRIVVRDKEI